MEMLVRPTVELQMSFLAAVEELQAEGRLVGLQTKDLYRVDAFATYLQKLASEELEDAVRPTWMVPQTTRWWVDGDTYIGRISVRHRLTDRLRLVGGHIGYDVRPSRRSEGHATSMLAAALPLAHHLGIDPALLTCDDDNVASARVIEKNGGVLENVVGRKLRFWVPTHCA